MSYKQIHDQFWTDPKIKVYEPNHKYLFIYLITNPLSHYSGIYYLPKAIIKEETGLSDRAIDRAIDTLSNGGVVDYDIGRSMVFVKNMIKYQTQGCNLNKNQKAGIVNHFEKLHNTPLIKEFLERYNFLEINFIYTPMDTPIDRSHVNVIVSDVVNDNALVKESFEKFWKIYPKRDGKRLGKGKAFDKFKKLKPEQIPEILISVENYSKSKRVSDGYIKDPLRFFEANYWHDWMEPENPSKPKQQHAGKTVDEYDFIKQARLEAESNE